MPKERFQITESPNCLHPPFLSSACQLFGRERLFHLRKVALQGGNVSLARDAYRIIGSHVRKRSKYDDCFHYGSTIISGI